MTGNAKRLGLSAIACLCLLSGTVQAQVPLKEATVSDIIELLRENPARYNYKVTAPPDTATNLCADQAVQGAPNAAPTATRLGVVELAPPAVYAGGEAPKVDLAIQFQEGRDVIQPASDRLLNTLFKALQEPALANVRLAIAGHADVSGNERQNLMLSCARALAVRQYLIGRGISAARLTAYGFGHSRLLDSHKNSPNSPVHRRVEVRRAP
jgi:outer membrane protein OmpA-like peptidoglycan-associated protein